MALKKIQTIEHIADNLAFFSKGAHIKSVIGLFEDARGAQDFFAGLFNLMHGYELEELDKLHEVNNFKAIDLGDEKAKVAIQVTIENDSYKINQTIKKFNEAELYNTYNRLIICVVGSKLKYTSSFNTDGKFTFNPDKDIWDDNTLIKQINSVSDINLLTQIDEYIRESLDEYKLPEHLYDQDIKDSIIFIKKSIDSILIASNTDRSIPIRYNDYMKDKNIINNVSWDFFVANIQGHLSYNSFIEDFLKNPINSSLLDDYIQITDSIQNYYTTNKSLYPSLEDLFRYIFFSLPRDYDNQVDERKIKIILHNMYFSCDLGINPDNA